MPTRTRCPYAPLPPSIPHVLAPSSPVPPDFDAAVDALASTLAETDKPRRRYGSAHAAPAALGLPQLVSTGVCGRWGTSDGKGEAPPWVLARRTRPKDEQRSEQAEQRAWEQLGVAGLPRDERQAEQWEEVKRAWRAERAVEQASVAETEVTVQKAGRKSAGKNGQAALTGHFAASKPTLASSSSKKRPPSSPASAHSPAPPPAPPPVPDVKTVEGKGGPATSTSFPTLSSINSVGQTIVSPVPRRPRPRPSLEQDQEYQLASDDDGEVLYERGCTQMLLPDPTPSANPPSSRPPSVRAPHSSAAALFSSPGLRPSAPGVTVSTPHAHAHALGGVARQLPSPSASPQHPPRAHSPPQPGRPAPPSRAPTQLSSLSAPGAVAGKPALQRLSSIARTASAVSSRAGEAEGDDGGWERFLEEDARD